MVPQKLEISNFMSYRHSAVLDFTGIHLACISGANGAGKSSLLEAMTWALFGKSRSRSDDDVVNRIAASMGDSAEIRFQFSLEDTLYRIIRRKKAGGRAMLDFQIATADGGWKTLSEGRMRETQAVIESTLKMNYDTFINASFFLQGQADAFTTKTAGQRKEILADLLGVSQWDVYRDAVSENRRGVENQLQLLDGRLQDIADELTEQDTREAQLHAAQADAERVKVQLEAQETLMRQLRQTAERVKQQEKLLADLETTLKREQDTLAAARRRQQQRQTERDGYQQWLDQADAIETVYAAWQSAEKELKQWQAKATRYNQLQQAFRPYELKIAATHSQLTQQQKSLLAQQQRVTGLVAEQEPLAARQQQAQQEIEQLVSALATIAEQEQALHSAQTALEKQKAARSVIESELTQLLKQQVNIEKLAREKETVHANLAEAEVALGRLATRSAELQEQRTQLAEAQGTLNALKAAQPELKEKMEALRERLDRLSADTGSQCPLCGQELTAAHRDAVTADIQHDGTQLADTYRANTKHITTLQRDIAQLKTAIERGAETEKGLGTQQARQAQAVARLATIAEAQTAWETDGTSARITQLQGELADDTDLRTLEAQAATLQQAVKEKARLEKEREAAQRTLSASEARLAEIARAKTEWQAEGESSLKSVQHKLAADDFEPEARAALADLMQQADALGYDADKHAAAAVTVENSADAVEKRQQLQQAQAAIKPLAEALSDLAQQIEGQTAQIATLSEQVSLSREQVAALKADAADVLKVEDTVFELREKQNDAERKVGVAQQRVAVLDDRRAQEKRLSAERADTTHRIQRLKQLEEACGRNGVQALLIERALPEIEDSANEILDRLTEGRMHISFETQRQLKSRKELAETLDIHIIDNAGERPYENYSGGEQFRINFAIRLALSQILARRAGARLQTLVVDEGFGSQDPNGRQRLIEAINAIQPDFERILVITHIDELRDAFPTRIDVTKSAEGSIISVI